MTSDTQTQTSRAQDLVRAFEGARRESRKLQAQARKTNKALAQLEEELEKRGIKLRVSERIDDD